MSKLSRHKRPLIETLEPRLLFSATADIAVFDDGSADITQLSEAAAKLDLTAIYLPPADPLLDAQTAAQRITSLVVVDTAVENYKQFVEDIRQQHSTGDLEIVYLDTNSDGVVQITQQLTQFSRLDSLHIISHGADGSVALGSTLLSTNNLFQYEDELIAWRTALGENADILIYGCDVAATVQGREFIAELAALTDADVAASDDATGHNTLSGDWDLEFSVGSIEQTVVVSTAVQEAWVGVLASTHYINIQGGTSVQSVSSVSGVGQSFLYDSPGATYTVNQISVQLRVESGAANQDITIQLLDGGWNDASPLATQTINSDQLDSTFGWKTFNFGDVVLNDSQTYIIKITTNNADGKVSVAYKSDAWNNSEMIVNGTGNSSADLNFLLSYNNGSNQAPVNTVPGAQSTNQNTPLIFSSIYGNQIQVADADAFPNDLEVTLNAAQGSFSLAQTTGLTFIGGDGTNDFYMLFRGSVAEINAALSTITYTPVNNFVGGDTFSITTKDLGLSGGLQDTDNIAITINNVNDAPTVVIAETSYAVDEQALLDLHGTGIVINDSDGDTLTVTVEAPSTYSQLTALVGTTGVIISSGNATNVLTLTGTSTQLNNLFAGNNGGTLTYRLAGDTPSATQQLTISASDGSLSANDSALINITAINDPVTLANPIVNQIATEESLFSFTFAADTFADVDGDLLTYTATLANGDALPAWLHFNAGTRTFSGVPDDGDVGFISVKVTANDGNGSTADDTFDITINGVNDDPFVNIPVPNQNATEDSVFTYIFPANTFGDGDVGATFSYTAELADGGALPAWLNFDSATRTFSGTPTNSDVGTISVKLNANDGAGGTANDVFDVVIANTNDAPTVANPIGNQTATESALFNYTFPINAFSDQDLGDSLTYSATLAGGGALPGWLSFDSATRTFSGTPSNGDVGTISISVTADDGEATVSDTFDVVIGNVDNFPFLITPIPNQNATEDAAFNFQFDNATFDDPNVGDTLTYTATMADGSALPAWLSFDAVTRTFSGTPANADVGTISIRVTADDGNGGTPATDTFDLVVANTNDVPTVANPIPNANATEDAAFNFTFAANTFADQDVGNALTYSAQTGGGGALPAWLNFDGATRTFSGTPTNAHVGAISIDVIANDGNGGTVTDTFSITVANTNDVPILANAIPNQNATEDSAFNFQFNSNTFSDVDVSDTLTYSAQLAGGSALPAWLSFDPVTRTFSGTPLNAHVGTVSIEVIADDGNGGSVTDTFTITVANTNDAPSVTITATDYFADEQTPIDLHGTGISVADVDGDALTITLTAEGSNSNLAATVGTTGVVIVSGVNTNTLVLTGTAAQLNDLFAGNGGSTLTYRLSGDTPVATRMLTISANDGSLSGSDTATINITALNDAPENTVPGGQVTSEDTSLVFSSVNGNRIQIDDLDVGTGNLQVTLSVTNGTLTLGGTTGLIFTTGDGTNDSSLVFSGTKTDINNALSILTFNPTTGYNGTAVLAITTSDLGNSGSGGVLIDSDTVNITITAVNDAPTVANTIPNQNTAEDSAFNFQFNINTFADSDVGDTLTYTAQLAGGGALPAWLSFDPVTRTFSGIPTNGDIGAVSIDVIADDGNGGIVTDTFNVVVANTNDAPIVANTIPNQNTAEDSTFNFQFNSNTFSDVDVGDTLTYTAQLAGGGALPAWLSFDPVTRTFSGIPTNGDIGAVSIDVIADDGNGGIVTDTFNVVVANTNDAPIVANTIPNQNTAEDSAFNFQFNSNTFADADVGDTLTYTAQLAGGGALPAWLSFDPVTRTFSGTPTNGDVGAILIDVIANDGNSAVTDTFMITVVNVNDAPTAITIDNMTMVAGDAPQQIDLRNKFFDIEDVVTLNFELMGNSNPDAVIDVQMDQNTGMMTIVVSSENAGESIIRLRAIDSDGAWVESSFKVTVSAKEPPVAPPVIIPPVIVAPPIITPDVDESTPPTIPDPIIPPVVVLPENQNPGVIPPTNGDESTLSPALPDEPDITSEVVDQELLVNGDEYDSPYNVVEDKSAQDYERVVQLLNSNALQVSSLTASTSLVSLIVPDAGFAPWEAAEFDSEVRRIRAQMDEALEEEHDRKALIAGISFSLTTGLLIWSLRASSLLLAMVSMLPLWRGLDPLPILDEVNKRKKELEQQRKDRKHEDKNAKEVGYLFDHAQQKTKDV
ncbi:putative Ig domain-containing protein [Cellvibrio sp. QJXJ]|uniref:putative Ig domain-containing protein n=1 Tax=Cellvibrio sp. QJXJ TaxID=2964606 RepID=UPI0021C321B9|nr:putative Ig domain-containing protein [Cellvibrio sp. QJXJ]UUA72965.1 putative Ig domain-containing protein [Cellvibrio sp. QJXJ]